MEQPWKCPQCGVMQRLDEIRTIEILEPGKEARVEYHGKIRATYRPHRIYNDASLRAFQEHPYVEYSCLVCGYSWADLPTLDPTPPGGASVTFLHPITECDDECDGQCCDRDAC